MRKNTVVALLLALALLFGFAVPAQAAGNPPEIQQEAGDELTLYFAYTNNIYTLLSISSGKAYLLGDVTGYQGITTKIEITLTLQKKTLLVFWSDVASWSATFNRCDGILYKEYGVSSGTYRMVATYKVYKGTAYETINEQTASISA